MTRQHIGQGARTETSTSRIEVAPPQSLRALGPEHQLDAPTQRVCVEQEGPQSATTSPQRQRRGERGCSHATRTAHNTDQACLVATVEGRRKDLEDAVLLGDREDPDGSHRDRDRPPRRRVARHQEHMLPTRQLGPADALRHVVTDDDDRRLPPRASRGRDIGRHLGNHPHGGAPPQRIVEEALVGGGDQGQLDVRHGSSLAVAPFDGQGIDRACGRPGLTHPPVYRPILVV